MYKSGKTMQECGDAFGLSRERVRQLLNSYDVEERRMWTHANSGRVNQVLELYRIGEELKDIAVMTGIPFSVISTTIPKYGHTDERRRAQFWRKAAVTQDEMKCWEWLGCTHPANGYGVFRCKGMMYAHRVAFYMHHGRKPSMYVLHSCDNTKCVNPNHLREGTPQENVIDRDTRHRNAKDTGRSGKRLSQTEVDEIRSLLAKGMVQHRIATLFDVNVATVNAINTGRTRSKNFLN